MSVFSWLLHWVSLLPRSFLETSIRCKRHIGAGVANFVAYRAYPHPLAEHIPKDAVLAKRQFWFDFVMSKALVPHKQAKVRALSLLVELTDSARQHRMTVVKAAMTPEQLDRRNSERPTLHHSS